MDMVTVMAGTIPGITIPGTMDPMLMVIITDIGTVTGMDIMMDITITIITTGMILMHLQIIIMDSVVAVVAAMVP